MGRIQTLQTRYLSYVTFKRSLQPSGFPISSIDTGLKRNKVGFERNHAHAAKREHLSKGLFLSLSPLQV